MTATPRLRTVTIPVKDEAEADAMRRALADPMMHAFVVVVGHLSTLPSDRSRARVLRYVEDLLSDDDYAAVLAEADAQAAAREPQR